MMSTTNSQNKKTCWDSLLQLFCITSFSNKKEIQEPLPRAASTNESSHQKLSMEKREELTPRPSIVYDEPSYQPRPSSAPETTPQQPQPSAPINGPEQNGNMLRSKFSVRRKPSAPLAETLDQAGARVEAAPIPAPMSPVEPKKCHRRWSSASMSRPEAYTLPKEALRRSATTTIGVDLVTDGLIEPHPAPARPHIYTCLRTSEKRLPPRPPTPPFGRVKTEYIPLPPPLPATFQSTTMRKKSLSGVSQWLFHQTDDSHLESAMELFHPMPVKPAISQRFAASPQWHNGSNTTINTLGLGDGPGIVSAWSMHGMEAAEAEFFELILESKMCSPLSGVARAA